MRTDSGVMPSRRTTTFPRASRSSQEFDPIVDDPRVGVQSRRALLAGMRHSNQEILRRARHPVYGNCGDCEHGARREESTSLSTMGWTVAQLGSRGSWVKPPDKRGRWRSVRDSAIANVTSTDRRPGPRRSMLAPSSGALESDGCLINCAQALSECPGMPLTAFERGEQTLDVAREVASCPATRENRASDRSPARSTVRRCPTTGTRRETP